MMRSPKVNSIIELLDAKNPAAIQGLRARFPDELRMLSSGLLLGGDSDANARNAFIYCDLARTGIETARNDIKSILTELPRREVWAKRLKLFAAIVSAITSAGIVSSVLLGQPKATIVGAVLNIIAAVVGLVATYVETPMFGSRSTAELIEECLKLDDEVRKAWVSLQEILRRENGDCFEIVAGVNDICAKLRRISLFGGVKTKSEFFVP
jgi:hypothetical protein